eukprot:TRINITY_DN35541_c0_g1_i1.p1 TRINITY_DN35541_c0_g1~~TRINITY_DN35541_c0_g1_i1.p1  ORF type:complete len:2519 (+),score=642.26 TRINITY_DN35541_c0_g1_i1:54-7559(+)
MEPGDQVVLKDHLEAVQEAFAATEDVEFTEEMIEYVGATGTIKSIDFSDHTVELAFPDGCEFWWPFHAVVDGECIFPDESGSAYTTDTGTEETSSTGARKPSSSSLGSAPVRRRGRRRRRRESRAQASPAKTMAISISKSDSGTLGAALAGLMVVRVLPGSTAAAAGVRVGMKVLTVDGTRMSNQGDIECALAAAPETFEVVVELPKESTHVTKDVDFSEGGCDWALVPGAVAYIERISGARIDTSMLSVVADETLCPVLHELPDSVSAPDGFAYKPAQLGPRTLGALQALWGGHLDLAGQVVCKDWERRLRAALDQQQPLPPPPVATTTSKEPEEVVEQVTFQTGDEEDPDDDRCFTLADGHIIISNGDGEELGRMSHAIFDQPVLIVVPEESEVITLDIGDGDLKAIAQLHAMCQRVGVDFSGEVPKQVEQENEPVRRTQIQVGDYVRVKAEVERPEYGWGSVQHGHVGQVTEVDSQTCRIDFHAQSGWRGLLSQTEIVQPDASLSCGSCGSHVFEARDVRTGWVCDSCGQHFGAGSHKDRWRCFACDHDLCRDCYGEKQRASEKKDGRQEDPGDLVAQHNQVPLRFKGVVKTTVRDTLVPSEHTLRNGERVCVSEGSGKHKKRGTICGFSGQSTYKVRMHGGGTADVAQDHLTAVPGSRPGRRLKVGSKVMLAAGHEDDDGPLVAGQVATVYREAGGSLRVETEGSKHSTAYQAEQLVLVDDSRRAELAPLECGDEVSLSSRDPALPLMVTMDIGDQGTVVEVDSSDCGVCVRNSAGEVGWFPATSLVRLAPPMRRLVEVLQEAGAPAVDPDGPVLAGTSPDGRMQVLPVELCLSRSLAGQVTESAALEVRLAVDEPDRSSGGVVLPEQPADEDDPEPPTLTPVELPSPQQERWRYFRVTIKPQRGHRRCAAGISLAGLELCGPGKEPIPVTDVTLPGDDSDDDSDSSSSIRSTDGRPGALLDGDPSTECVLRGVKAKVLVFHVDEAVKYDSLRWMRGEGGRPPASWQVAGAESDEGPWVVLAPTQEVTPEESRLAPGKWSRHYRVSEALDHVALGKVYDGGTVRVKLFSESMLRQKKRFGGKRCCGLLGVVEEKDPLTGTVRVKQQVPKTGGWFSSGGVDGCEEVSFWWEARHVLPVHSPWKSTRTCRGTLRISGHPQRVAAAAEEMDTMGTFVVTAAPRFATALATQILVACGRIAEREGGTCFGRALAAADGTEAGWLCACGGGAAARVASVLRCDLSGTAAPKVRPDLMAKSIRLVEQTTGAIVVVADDKVTVVGGAAARRRGFRILADVSRVREVLLRVPVVDQAVLELHRHPLQVHSGAAISFYKGALLQIQGTSASVERARKGIAALLAHQWEATQKTRWERTAGSAAAAVTDVRVRCPLSARLLYLLAPPTTAAVPAEPTKAPQIGVPDVEALARESGRQREALLGLLTTQLCAAGVTDTAQRKRCPQCKEQRLRRAPASITCDHGRCSTDRVYNCSACGGDYCERHAGGPTRFWGTTPETQGVELVRRLLTRFDEDRDGRLDLAEFTSCFRFLVQRMTAAGGHLPPPDEEDLQMLWHHASEGTVEGLGSVLEEVLYGHADSQGVLPQLRERLQRDLTTPPTERKERKEDKAPKVDASDVQGSIRKRLLWHLQAHMDAFDASSDAQRRWADFQNETQKQVEDTSTQTHGLAGYLSSMLTIRVQATETITQLRKVAAEQEQEVAQTLAALPPSEPAEEEPRASAAPVDATGSLIITTSSNSADAEAIISGSDDYWESDGRKASADDPDTWHWFEAALPQGKLHEVHLVHADHRSYTPRLVRVDIGVESGPLRVVGEPIEIESHSDTRKVKLLTPEQAQGATRIRVSVMANHRDGIDSRIAGIHVMAKGCPERKAGSRTKGPKWWSAKSLEGIREALKGHPAAIKSVAANLTEAKARLYNWADEVEGPLRRTLVAGMAQLASDGTLLASDVLAKTGCLVAVSREEKTATLFGPELAVQKAQQMLRDFEHGVWPPDYAQGEAQASVGAATVQELNECGGLLKHCIKALSSLSTLEVQEDRVRMLGSAGAVREAVRLLAQAGEVGAVEWQGELGALAAVEAIDRSDPVCACCLTECQPSDSNQLLCGHWLHHECGAGLVKFQQQEGGNGAVQCPGSLDSTPASGTRDVTRCPYELGYDDFFRISGGSKTAASYQRGRIRDALVRRGVLAACPQVGCDGYAVRDVQEGVFENLFCLTCRNLFCPGSVGSRPHVAHFFSTCDEAQQGGVKGPGDDEATRKLIEESCRPCPGRGCGVPVYRTDACPHMTCRACKCEWCWYCLKPYAPEDYEVHGFNRGYYRCDCCPEGSLEGPTGDHALLQTRIHAAVSMQKGVLFYGTTQCDACPKFPIPNDEAVYSCMQCLNHYLCAECVGKGRTCGSPGHALQVVEREEAPAERTALQKAPERVTRGRKDLFDIDWLGAMKVKEKPAGGPPPITRSCSDLMADGGSGLVRANTSHIGWAQVGQYIFDSDSDTES